MASQTTRNYASASFSLELAGTIVGFLRSVQGGEPFGDVVNEPVDAGGVVKKHVGNVHYQPIVMTFGPGMDKAVYQWMADVLNHKPSTKSGAIIFADYNYKEKYRLEFDNALIAQIDFPAVDANSKDAGFFTLTLQPQVTRINAALLGTSINGFAPKSKKRWIASNFRLKISGLETACAKVNAVQALSVTQTIGEKFAPGVLNIPNVVFTVAESAAQSILSWMNDFLINRKNDQASERSGTLEFLDVSLKEVLFTLQFSNLGVIGTHRLRLEQNAQVIARVGFELYCEQMTFVPEAGSIGNAITSTASTTAAGSSSATLTEAVINAVAVRLVPDSTLQVLNARQLSQSSTPTTLTAPEMIARRLMATAQPAPTGPVVPKWDDGVVLGEQWATDTATIDELNEIKTINQDDWSALNLETGHTLIDKLRSQGMIPDGADGPLQLERDAFVEGIVAGAIEVLGGATPHLSRLSDEK